MKINIKLDSIITINNCYISGNEHEFVCVVENELKLFTKSDSEDSLILIFPPLKSKFRFLVHETVNQLYADQFSTISIGKEGYRRLVIYPKYILSNMSKNVLSSDREDCTQSNTQQSKLNRRPDKKLYIPPRSKNNQTVVIDSKAKQDISPAESPSWDSLYDENGDMLDANVANELNAELGTKILAKQLRRTKLDYSKYESNNSATSPKNTNDNVVGEETEFGHVLEVYDFAPELKTRDLVIGISAACTKNFEIDWVDDTHALIIFPSILLATEALGKVFPNLKIRPLSQGINESKLKAKKRFEDKSPRKPRPETTTLLARRLVAGALGIKADMDPEQRKAEREKLRLAREKKKQVQKQVKNAWDGDNA